MKKLDPVQLAMSLGILALALILGALGFQYLAHLPPCEMCMWQRYPHIAAAIIGIGGALLIYGGIIDRKAGSCTGPAFQFQGTLDLNAPMVRCDAAAWRLFGLSLAGYNALISLGVAVGAFFLLAGSKKAK